MLEPNFTPFPLLKTERLLLREITDNDADAIFALRSDPVVMQYIDRPLATSLAEALAFIKTLADALASNNGITWGISLKEVPGELIGFCGYWRFVKEHYRAELGYSLLSTYWRKGIMKEALNKIIPFAYDGLKLHSIEAKINPGNIASANILESVGFVREAYFKEDFFYGGKFRDTVVYSRLKNNG